MTLLTKVEVYTSKQDVDTLEITDAYRLDLDYLHITNIDGLDPVTSSISSVILPSADLSVISGKELPARNIVFTVSPNPDWYTWKPEQLRRLIYAYFTPQSTVQLIFTTDELDYPAEIYGVVEACSYNQYAKNPSYQISIICADPHFTSTQEQVIEGTVIAFDDWPPSEPILIGGDVPIGCKIQMVDGYDSGELYIQVDDPSISTFHLIVDSNPAPNTFDLDSRPLHKVVRTFENDTGIVTNLLGKLEPGYQAVWPVLYPGNNLFAVMGDNVGDAWILRYFEKYGGL